MTDPNTPSITEGAAAPATHTISLADLHYRYLSGFQRVFDVASVIVAGVRQINEREYDDFSASVRFLPSQRDHRNYDAAKDEAERWILKNLLADGVALIVPFLEDVRSVAALSQWKASNSTDQKALQAILTEQRQGFLRMDLKEKFTHLQNHHGITSDLSSQILALAKVGGCLAARGGVVSEQDTTSGGELAVILVALQLVPMKIDEKTETAGTATSGATIVPQIGEIRRAFSVGQTIKFEKSDYLNLIATLAIFATSILKSLQDVVKKHQAA